MWPDGSYFLCHPKQTVLFSLFAGTLISYSNHTQSASFRCNSYAYYFCAWTIFSEQMKEWKNKQAQFDVWCIVVVVSLNDFRQPNPLWKLRVWDDETFIMGIFIFFPLPHWFSSSWAPFINDNNVIWDDPFRWFVYFGRFRCTSVYLIAFLSFALPFRLSQSFFVSVYGFLSLFLSPTRFNLHINTQCIKSSIWVMLDVLMDNISHMHFFLERI